jgi:hypothetical protein
MLMDASQRGVYTGKEGKRLRRFDKGVEQDEGSAERQYFNEALSFLQSDMSPGNKSIVRESGAYPGKRGIDFALPAPEHGRSVHRNSRGEAKHLQSNLDQSSGHMGPRKAAAVYQLGSMGYMSHRGGIELGGTNQPLEVSRHFHRERLPSELNFNVDEIQVRAPARRRAVPRASQATVRPSSLFMADEDPNAWTTSYDTQFSPINERNAQGHRSKSNSNARTKRLLKYDSKRTPRR